ncbi:MAG: type IV toxin-antitoxin system AbiEi family antitoxin domain-containing protein [Proteobacteria bacterium]|nr:type IV toxin-antitoxin system AbiEi family antitoxin domain-containing protein [Pseudomonadota bacterium]
MVASTPRDALEVFEQHGGILRTKDALAQGIHPRTLYELRDQGVIAPISRGVYRLASLPELAYPDLVAVALRVPRAVVCLVSALAYHDCTSEVPHEVQIALPRGTKAPQLDSPPIRVHRFSGAALTEGIEVVPLDGIAVRIYSLGKTIVDCFRFRNRLGTDVAVEAMSEAITQQGIRPAEILHYARLCRIETVILPYLEAIQ